MIYFPTIIYIIGVLLVSVPVLLIVAFVTVAERKTMASMQRRLGPNIVEAYGLLEAFADALKLLIKEYISPTQANVILFFLGPVITLIFSLLGYAVVPYGPVLSIWDFNLGILFLLAVFSLTAYGILLGERSPSLGYASLNLLVSGVPKKLLDNTRFLITSIRSDIASISKASVELLMNIRVSYSWVNHIFLAVLLLIYGPQIIGFFIPMYHLICLHYVKLWITLLTFSISAIIYVTCINIEFKNKYPKLYTWIMVVSVLIVFISIISMLTSFTSLLYKVFVSYKNSENTSTSSNSSNKPGNNHNKPNGNDNIIFHDSTEGEKKTGSKWTKKEDMNDEQFERYEEGKRRRRGTYKPKPKVADMNEKQKISNDKRKLKRQGTRKPGPKVADMNEKQKASYKRSEANRVRKPRKKVGDMTPEEHQRETEKRRSEFGKGRAAKILNRAIESSFDIFDN
jgi:hypothetical protein